MREGNAVVADPQSLRRFGSAVVAGEHRHGAAEPGAISRSIPQSEPARAGQGADAHADRVARVSRRPSWPVVGCMGADGQPQIHLQTYVAMIDCGLDIAGSARHAALRCPDDSRLAKRATRCTSNCRFPEATHRTSSSRAATARSLVPWNELARSRARHHRSIRNGVRVGGSDPGATATGHSIVEADANCRRSFRPVRPRISTIQLDRRLWRS